MDSAIMLFALILLAVFVGAFILVGKNVEKNRKEYERSRTLPPTAEAPKVAAPAAPAVPTAPSRVTSTVAADKARKWEPLKKKAAEPEVDLNKVSIYAYRPAVKRSICPFCDGENPETADTCIICGQALR